MTGTSLLDDDKELADKYADGHANPYADDASNNEKANINTKSVKPGQNLFTKYGWITKLINNKTISNQ